MREIIGLDIVEMPAARMSPDELYKNPKLRADDSIDGIITSIGGYESVRILQYLTITVLYYMSLLSHTIIKEHNQYLL